MKRYLRSWFLSIAAKQGYVVDRYQDAAVGVMGPNSEGRMAMLDVMLRPAVTCHPAAIAAVT